MSGIPALRLSAQRLAGEPLPDAVEAVRWLGAVQSQDYPAAKWALAQRTRAATDADLDRLYDEGAILRTHVMRPTWHFVLPQDIRWLLELTAVRLRATLAGRHRQLELDAATKSKAHRLFVRELGGGRAASRGVRRRTEDGDHRARRRRQMRTVLALCDGRVHRPRIRGVVRSLPRGPGRLIAHA